MTIDGKFSIVTGVHRSPRYLGSLVRAKLAREARPIWVDVCVTNRCHLSCEYCYGDYHHRRDSIGQFNYEQLCAIVDEAASLGTAVMTLTGGEPMLHKSIGRIIDRAVGLGISVGMVTSGFRVKERVDELVRLSSIVLSVDGPEPINDLNRGEGTFAVSMGALEVCQARGIPRIVKAVLNRRNKDQVPWLIDLAARFDARLEVVMSYSPQSDRQLRIHGDNSLDSGERQVLADALLAYKREGAPLVFRERVWENMALWWQQHGGDRVTEEEKKPRFPYLPCSAGRYYAFIDGDGRMYPCNQRLADFPAKNVLEVGFRSAWEHLHDHGCFACAAPWLNQQHLVSSEKLLVRSLGRDLLARVARA
ncbi:radical SAM/SPASM domain-containing protein [Sorangium sp. So ce1389]|uniref:radical SAM/SPASM domain-containing protein n=1 Tax=Sorangium sp. So ce1389 TaxID=3133336 RepID=UPI003F5DD9E2